MKKMILFLSEMYARHRSVTAVPRNTPKPTVVSPVAWCVSGAVSYLQIIDAVGPSPTTDNFAVFVAVVPVLTPFPNITSHII